MNKTARVLTALVLFTLLDARTSHAFISPGSLAILSAALGSLVWGFTAVIAVNIALFFRRGRLKLAIFAVSAVVLVVMSGAVLWRYIRIKEINIEKLKGVVVQAKNSAYPDEFSLFDDIPLIEYELDLNLMTQKEMAGYKLIQIRSSLDPLVFVKGAKVVGETDSIIVDDPATIFINLDKFILDNGIKKSDRLLIICHSGGSSGRVATLLNNDGYNAHFSLLTNLKSTSLVTTLYDKPKKDSSIVLVPYEWRDKQKTDAFIRFGFIHPVIDLTKAEQLRFAGIAPENFVPRLTQQYNIICFSNIHCILTKYFLDKNGVKEARIYKYPLDIAKYRDWTPQEFEALKKWKRQ